MLIFCVKIPIVILSLYFLVPHIHVVIQYSHILFSSLLYHTSPRKQQTFSGNNTSAVRRLISHRYRTSGSLVFATEDGCWSAQTCNASLKLCVSTSKKCLFMPNFTLPTHHSPPTPHFLSFLVLHAHLDSTPPRFHRTGQPQAC